MNIQNYQKPLAGRVLKNDLEATLAAVENPQEVYAGRPVLGKYRINRPSDAKMEEWKEGIDDIFEYLQEKDVEALKEVMGETRSKKYLKNIDEVLDQDLDNDDYRLLAIGMFFQANKPAYLGGLKTRMQMAKGRNMKLDKIFDEDGNPNCIDAAYLFQEVAKEYGIKGEVKTIALKPIPPKHQYFVTDDDKVLDVMVTPGLTRGGLFKDEQEFLKLIKDL